MGAPSPARSRTRPRHGLFSRVSTVSSVLISRTERGLALSLPLSAETVLLHTALVLRLVVRTRRAQRPDARDGSSSVLCSDLPPSPRLLSSRLTELCRFLLNDDLRELVRPAHVYFPPV